MQQAWTVFLHYFLIVAPWLVAAGIPSLIVTLTPYPKAGGVIKVLSVLMNVLSALTHSDSPGTMKLPLTQSKPPGEDASAVVLPRRAAGFIHLEVLIVIGILGALALISGCASGTDGLRQSCANADTAISGGYQLASSWYHNEQVAIRAQHVTDASGAELRFARDHELMSKALDGLDEARKVKVTLCVLADAIDAGLKRDLGALLAQIAQVILDAQAAIQPLIKVA